MSYSERAYVPPRNATVQDVENQINQLRNQLQNELRKAQQQAVDKASKRAEAIQREQIRKIQDSINALDKASRRNLEEMDRRHREQLETITTRIYDDIAKSQQQTQQQLKRHVDRKIDNLASDVTNQIKGLDAKIQKQRERDMKAIDQQMKAIVDDINNMAKDINNRFEQNEQEIADIQSDLADIHKRFNNEDELARQTVDAANKLLGLVEGRTMLDRFAPEYETQDLRTRMVSLNESTLNGAALTAKAEEAITQIWQTERHAIQEKAKHDAMVEVAMTQVEKVLGVINENRELEREVVGGDPFKVECNFWSEGEYEELEEELRRLERELEDRYNSNLTKERIEEITQRSAEIENRILQIAGESIAKATLSEARVETVEDIVNAMESKGWVIKGPVDHPEFNYMGGEVDHDWRKGVCAVLENNVGEEITVIVDPLSDSQNRLIVHQETSKSGKTDKEVHEKMKTIKDEMCSLGYEIGGTTANDIHIPEMGSTERLGKAHATERIREKLNK